MMLVRHKDVRARGIIMSPGSYGPSAVIGVVFKSREDKLGRKEKKMSKIASPLVDQGEVGVYRVTLTT